MLKIFENKIIVGGICIFIAALLSFLVLPGIYKSKDSTTIVIKLTEDVRAGTRIEKGMLKEIEIGSYGLPKGVVTNADEITGKYAVSNICKDELLFSKKFVEYASDERLDKILAEGKKLVSVSVASNAASVANHLKSGDVVTLVCYVDNKAVIYDELRNIEIYSVENENAVNVEGVSNTEDKADTIPATLTLIVNDAQAQKLVSAEYSGKLHAVFERRGAIR